MLTSKLTFDVSHMTEAALEAFLGLSDSAGLTAKDLASMSPQAVQEMNARHVQSYGLARRNLQVCRLAQQDERPGAWSFVRGSEAWAFHNQGWTPADALTLAEKYDAEYGPGSGCLGGITSDA